MSTNPFEQFNTPTEQPEVPKDPNPYDQFNTPAVPALVEEPQTESGFFSRSLDELKGLGEINTTFDKYGDGSIPKSPAQVVVGEAADVLQAGSNILVDGGLTMLDKTMFPRFSLFKACSLLSSLKLKILEKIISRICPSSL